MIDHFVFFAPILLLAIIALLQFVGCNQVFGVHEVEVYGPLPDFNPESGVVPQGQQVAMSAGPTGTIFYTLDGTDPAENAGGSTIMYTGPVTILETTAIRAHATYTESGVATSHIRESDYTVQPAFRQYASKDIAPSNPSTITTDPLPMPVIAGDLIVVWIWYNTNAATVLNVQDSAGNTYQSAVAPSKGMGLLANYTQEIWYGLATNGGAGIAVTANFQGAAFTTKKAIFAHEYAGLSPTNPFEAGNVGEGVGAAPGATVSTASITTTGKLVFGAGIFSNNGFAPNNFTARIVTADGNLSEDQIPPAGSTVRADFICPNGGDWLVQIATFT